MGKPCCDEPPRTSRRPRLVMLVPLVVIAVVLLLQLVR